MDTKTTILCSNQGKNTKTDTESAILCVSTYTTDTQQVTALSVPSKGSTENIVTNYETTG